jgi:hypothetical protein
MRTWNNLRNFCPTLSIGACIAVALLLLSGCTASLPRQAEHRTALLSVEPEEPRHAGHLRQQARRRDFEQDVANSPRQIRPASVFRQSQR